MPDPSAENVVVVAVRAEPQISKAALVWALTNVVRPGDLVTLLAVLTDPRLNWRQRLLWGFPGWFNGDRSSRLLQERCQASSSCSQITLQMEGTSEINVRIKVVGSDSSPSSHNSISVVAKEANKMGADWVVLDKQLKHEEKQCLKELDCNVVVVKGCIAKVLRLNIHAPNNKPYVAPFSSSSTSPIACSVKLPVDRINQHPEPVANGGSCRELSSISTTNTTLECHNPEDTQIDCNFDTGRISPPPPSLSSCPLSHNHGVRWIPQSHISEECPLTQICKNNHSRDLEDKLSESDRESLVKKIRLRHRSLAFEGHIQSTKVNYPDCFLQDSPSLPPPLCSLCRNMTPIFGKPPRQFSYPELEEATAGFSDENIITAGADGHTHKGVLADGQVVAVKLLNSETCTDPKCEPDFRTKIEILSRIQHRNVVMLVGFCAEEKRRVLVYEYICNGSLDFHLHGGGEQSLDWNTRVKIAVGVARGLRYLHEDCRMGFILHQDLRPNNILLTHDFEPLVFNLLYLAKKTDVYTFFPIG